MIIKAIKLSDSDKLLFAEEGENFRKKIVSLIQKENEKELVKIDMEGTKISDASFNREAFVKLITSFNIENQRPQILFINMNEYVKQNMHLSFNYHNLFALVFTDGTEFQLIGKYSSQILETARAMIALKKATAKDLCGRIDELELTAANNRLKTLFNMCVVTREEVGQESGGKEYIYYLRT